MRLPRVADASLYTIGLLVLVLALADLSGARWLGAADYALADAAARFRARSIPADPSIVIVDIDDRSLGALADSVGRFPWPRSVYAEVIQYLEARGAKAIVLDVELYEPDRVRPEHDAVLNDAVARTTNTFFALRLLDRAAPDEGVLLATDGAPLALATRGTPSPDARLPMLLPFVLDPSAWSRTGYINFLEDADGIGRRYWLEHVHGGYVVPSLPARLAQHFGWPLPAGETMLISWSAGSTPHRHVAFVDVYDDANRAAKTRPTDEFRDAIVIVGSSATHLRDFRPTPIDPLHSGVEILASAIDNLKNGRELKEAPRAASYAVLFALFVPLLGSLRRGTNVVKILAVLSLVTLGVGATAFAARATMGTIVYVGTALAYAWILFFLAAMRAYLREQRAKEQRERVLSRFLDPRVVKRLVAEGVRVEDFKSETRTITVLFSDIRGFTTLSEKHSAEQIVVLLNRYFSAQVENVFRHGGTLDKFIGDAIMAFWNAPTDDPDHAANAVACARDMVATLERFNETLGSDGLRVDVGIGIHTGPAVVGFIGSERKLEYTAIGDTVNLASRIEGETKGRARVLVSSSTREHIAERSAAQFSFRDVGEVTVKGRHAAVRLFATEAVS